MKSPSFISALIAILALLGSPQVGFSQQIKVLANQIGYESDGPKQVVILGHPGDDVTSFIVLDAQTRQSVASGAVVKAGAVDQWQDWIFWTADFSDMRTTGSYLVQCATNQGQVDSFPFLVQRRLLKRATLSDVVYFFKDQRVVGRIDQADHHLKFEDSTDPDKRMDLHGGWADATGDSGKHLSHLNFSTYFNPQHGPLTTWAMFKCYDMLNTANDDGLSRAKLRMLDEAVYGADYLARSKNPNGSFFRSVDDNGPDPETRFIAKDGSGGIIPKTKNPNPLQNGDMSKISDEFLYEVGVRCGGGMAIAALAKASTYNQSGDYSSAEYLKAARDGFGFLQKYNLYYTNDGKENIIDDYCLLMAATELFKATGDVQYKQAADQRATNLMNRQISHGKYSNYWRADDGDRPFFHAADAGLPVISLLNYYDIADEPTRRKILDVVRKAMEEEMTVTAEAVNPFGYARQLVQSKNGNRRTTFFFPHDTDAAPWWQGENARLCSLAAAAHVTAGYFKDDPAFSGRLRTYATNQLNWVLGLNPYDVCMLKGSGHANPTEYIGAPGGICNGITSGLTNPDDIQFSFTSRDDDWRWNEQWLPHSTWYLLAISSGD